MKKQRSFQRTIQCWVSSKLICSDQGNSQLVEALLTIAEMIFRGAEYTCVLHNHNLLLVWNLSCRVVATTGVSMYDKYNSKIHEVFLSNQFVKFELFNFSQSRLRKFEFKQNTSVFNLVYPKFTDTHHEVQFDQCNCWKMSYHFWFCSAFISFCSELVVLTNSPSKTNPFIWLRQ